MHKRRTSAGEPESKAQRVLEPARADQAQRVALAPARADDAVALETPARADDAPVGEALKAPAGDAPVGDAALEALAVAADDDATLTAVDESPQAPAPPVPTQELLKLDRENAHPRDSRIVFVADDHVYWIDGVDGRTLGYRSVTTFSHFGFAQFDEDQTITDMMEDSVRWKRNKHFGMTRDEIKVLWAQNRDAASARGTYIHRQIELYYNDLAYDGDNREMAHFRSFVAAHPHLHAYRTELNLLCTQLRVAGQTDIIFRNDAGEYELSDWKCAKEIRSAGFCRCESRGIFDHSDSRCSAFGNHELTGQLANCNLTHYSLQLNVYKWLLEHLYGIPIARMFLVILHADQQDYRRIDLPVWQDLVDAIMLERAKELGLDNIDVTD
jgi:hypothetical protein